MLVRHLKRKVEIKQCEDVDCFKPFDLEYYLLESDNDDEQLECTKAYGVEVVKLIEQRPVEKALVKNYTYSKDAACELISLLADNTVTPVSFEFVLDDVLGRL